MSKLVYGHPVSSAIINRFEAKILPEPNSGCWLWTGSVDGGGYGTFWHGGRARKATRFSYAYWRGNFPDNLDLMHSCDLPCCVNPDHLTPGTTLENVNDMWRKGRGRPSRGSRNGKAKLNWNCVQFIKGMFAAGFEYSTIARRFDVDRSTVSRIINGTAWRKASMNVEDRYEW